MVAAAPNVILLANHAMLLAQIVVLLVLQGILLMGPTASNAMLIVRFAMALEITSVMLAILGIIFGLEILA